MCEDGSYLILNYLYTHGDGEGEAPCQYTLHFDLRPLIFGLTPFGWQHFTALTITESIIYRGTVIFDLRLFLSIPTFSETRLGRKACSKIRLAVLDSFVSCRKKDGRTDGRRRFLTGANG